MGVVGGASSLTPAPPRRVEIYGLNLPQAANFTANSASGRRGALAWDACPATHTNATFDNGALIWPAGGGCKKHKSGGVRRPAKTKPGGKKTQT